LILLLVFSGSTFVSAVIRHLAYHFLLELPSKGQRSRASLFKNRPVPGMNAATAFKNAVENRRFNSANEVSIAEW